MRPISNPPNPWATTEVEYLGEPLAEPPGAELFVYEDHTRTILAKNDSPDLGFSFSVNPYRGCFHGCGYCYARPTHEYLSFGAGTDFDRRLVVKPKAPTLLREAFEKASWKGDTVVFSGVTDCYQPLEAFYRLTRGCLEVCLEYKNPIGIVTKAPLIERDIDVLQALSEVARVGVAISIPLWNEAHARAIEPFVTTPKRRMRTIERLAKAGIDVGVNIAPLIPGLGEVDIPKILRAAKDAGATSAACFLLRLPGPVQGIFEKRLREALPEKADKVLSRIRDTRGGRLNDAAFGVRQTGEGEYAQQIGALFEASARKVGIEVGRNGFEEETTTFARPPKSKRQLTLF